MFNQEKGTFLPLLMLVDCDVVSVEVVLVTVMLTLASSASSESSLSAFGHLYEQGQMEVGRVKLSRKKPTTDKVIYGATFFREQKFIGVKRSRKRRAIHPSFQIVSK